MWNSTRVAMFVLVLLPALPAVAQTDQVSWAVVGAGSGTAATDHGMRAALGEPLIGVSSQGNVILHTGFLTNPFFLQMLTPVSPDGHGVPPLAFHLSQNYPNPFNPSTQIEYTVGVGGMGSKNPIKNSEFLGLNSPTLVRLAVYDILGREVAILVQEPKSPGTYTVRWNASQNASGVYWYTFSAGTFRETRKMLLLR